MNKSDERYLELLKRSLIDTVNPTTQRAVSVGDGTVRVEEVAEWERPIRNNGEDWPLNAVTMIGYARLTNLQECIETVVGEDVPGDFIEAGVWRGGAVIFMAAVLDVLGDTDRRVWAADSFRGLPEGDADRYPPDAADLHHTVEFLAVSEVEVKRNFAHFGVSTEQVRFLKGWFRDTLPTLAGERWSIVRLDGDMYESSMLGFECLYPGLSEDGFIIVDDYGVPGCRQATDEFRKLHGITSEAPSIGESESIYWRKSSEKLEPWG